MLRKHCSDKYFPGADHQRVQNVFRRIVSDPSNPGTGEARLKDCVIVGVEVAPDGCAAVSQIPFARSCLLVSGTFQDAMSKTVRRKPV